MIKRFVAPALAASIFVLAGCSGGSDSPSPPPPPVAPAPDTTPPVITLTGPSSVSLDFASEFTDQGATANDARDGAVAVTASGTVDPFTPGSYTITYTARDAAGNSATATRTVTVGQRQVRLTVSAFGAANFSIAGSAMSCSATGDICTADVDVGTEISVAGQTGPGWNFEYWRQCDAVQTTTCTVTMDQDKLVLFTASRPGPIELVPEAVLLTNAQIDAIRNFDPQSDSIFFSAGAPTANITVGAVIVADGTRSANISFARRVVDVLALTGAPTLIKTVNVALDDVIVEGVLIGRPQDFTASLPAGVRPGGGVTQSAGQASSAEPYRQVVVVNSVELYKDADTTITASGTVTVDFTPEVAADITRAGGLRSFRYSGQSTVEAALSVSVSGPVDGLAFDEEVRLPTINAGVVIVGPAVFVVEIEPILFAKGGLEVSISPQVSVRQVATLGVQYHQNSGWTNLSQVNVTGQVQFPETLTASASLEVGGGLEAALELWGVAGPFLRGDIYGGGRGTVKADPAACPVTIETYLGGRATAGGRATLFSRRLSVDVATVSIERLLSSLTPGCTADQEAPAAPANVVATATSNSTIRVAWSAATDNVGVAAYEVWRRDTNGGRARQIAVTSALLIDDRGLLSAQQYCYYILARDAAGNKSPIPADLSCATTFNAIDDTPPTAPQLTSIEALSTSSVGMAWTASTDNEGVASYFILDVTASDDAPFAVSESTALTGTVSRLNANTEYCYRVVASDFRGNISQPSNRLCVTTPPLETAEWTIFLGCQGREFLLDAKLDLDETINSFVEVSGSGFDYPGTPLTYSLRGIYEATTTSLSADIFWTFANNSAIRQDRFTANLATGNSGIVAMQQIQVTGCDAQVQIVRAESGSASASARRAPPAPGGHYSGLSLGSGPVR